MGVSSATMALRAPRTSTGPAKPPAFAFLPARGGMLQRECDCGGSAGLGGKCEECRQNEMGSQRLAAAPAASNMAPPIVHDVLRSPGQPLDRATRASLEPRFGHDFSRVRIHSDAKAAESARAVAAQAYTVGSDIVFGAGCYSPGTETGRRLLAHELTHVVQQGFSRKDGALTVGPVDDAYEQQAEAIAGGIGGQHFVPSTDDGAPFLAPELRHVVQQTGPDRPRLSANKIAAGKLQRQDDGSDNAAAVSGPNQRHGVCTGARLSPGAC